MVRGYWQGWGHHTFYEEARVDIYFDKAVKIAVKECAPLQPHPFVTDIAKLYALFGGLFYTLLPLKKFLTNFL
jgi:hypothetical protein